jgi:GTP pyrophosphokinase
MNRNDFFARVSDRPTVELRRIQLAYWLAQNAHRPFHRDSGEPFFEHPRDVALSLVNHGFRETDCVIQGLLHDVIEDTNTPCDVIVDLFGPAIWRSLEVLARYAPSFDPVTGQLIGRYKKSPQEYYAGIEAAQSEVKIVKCADRLHNLQTCGVWEVARKERYLAETEEYVIPIAKKLPSSYAGELNAVVIEVRTAITAAAIVA